jgi:hypothetical protein
MKWDTLLDQTTTATAAVATATSAVVAVGVVVKSWTLPVDMARHTDSLLAVKT